jgi:hypothetical protein
VSTDPEQEPVEENPPEANLHQLSDDDYFAAISEMPPVYDAEGNEVTGLFDDVVDLREAKRAGTL